MKLACLLFCCGVACTAAHRIPVWIDSDPSMAPGGHEVDDGLAWLQAFHSRELKVRGVSIVFGNAPLAQALPIARRFLPLLTSRLKPLAGAAGADQLGHETEASRAIAKALRQERLTILALGPLTNIGTVLRNHPELASRIVEVVAVAGRRPGQHFTTGNKAARPFRDLNFEMDPPAFQALLDSKTPVVLAPWEISSQVWLRSGDVSRLEHGGAAARWLLGPSTDWLNFWRRTFDVSAFNPFDTLAVGYVTSPGMMKCQDLPAEIREMPDDVQDGRSKPYLLAAPGVISGRIVKYCYEAAPEFHDLLMRRLLRK